MANIGLHIRLQHTMTAVAQKAIALKLPYFQTFVINASGHFFVPTTTDKKKFLELRPQFGPLFLHSSYWINCASSSPNILFLLNRELRLAHSLAFNFYVVHPGATKQKDSDKRFNFLVQNLETISKRYPHITILLENTAHARNAIGSSIEELGIIAQKLTMLNVGFCIDTAHAFSYGYDLTTPTHMQKFVNLIDQKIGLERVKLIHFNNTTQACGSRIDQHSITTRGAISQESLAYLLRTLPDKSFVAELPPLTTDKERNILDVIRQW